MRMGLCKQTVRLGASNFTWRPYSSIPPSGLSRKAKRQHEALAAQRLLIRTTEIEYSFPLEYQDKRRVRQRRQQDFQQHFGLGIVGDEMFGAWDQANAQSQQPQ
jgi:hypothetical protein